MINVIDQLSLVGVVAAHINPPNGVVFWVGRWVSPTAISKAQVQMMMMTGISDGHFFSVSLCLDLVFETQSGLFFFSRLFLGI